MSCNFCTIKEFAFTNWSLAGQQWLPHSDSWGHQNVDVGEVDPPHDDFPIDVRNMAENENLRKRRPTFWKNYKAREAKTRKREKAFGPREGLRKWAQTTRLPASWFRYQKRAAASSNRA